MEPSGWTVIDGDRAVLWREYEFSRSAYATTLVFRGADGLVVISPGSDPSPACDALAAHGEVRALVASSAQHHLGQAAWRARFPDAVSYAAPAALPQLAKRAPSIPFRSIEELALGPDASAHVLSGFTSGELLFTVRTTVGTVWYTGDLLTNIQRTPGPPLSWLFRWTGSAPGFRLFRLGVWGYVRDRRSVKDQVMALLDRDPPAIVVPGHGPPVTTGDVAAEARVQLGKL